MVCHFFSVRKFFGARSEESEPEESHQITKESNNYALLFLIEIQYSVVLMVVIGTMAIIYNYGKKNLL